MDSKSCQGKDKRLTPRLCLWRQILGFILTQGKQGVHLPRRDSSLPTGDCCSLNLKGRWQRFWPQQGLHTLDAQRKDAQEHLQEHETPQKQIAKAESEHPKEDRSPKVIQCLSDQGSSNLGDIKRYDTVSPSKTISNAEEESSAIQEIALCVKFDKGITSERIHNIIVEEQVMKKKAVSPNKIQMQRNDHLQGRLSNRLHHCKDMTWPSKRMVQ